MSGDMLAFRLSRNEKHALRILAAQSDMNLTDFILGTLRRYTPLETIVSHLETQQEATAGTPPDSKRASKRAAAVAGER